MKCTKEVFIIWLEELNNSTLIEQISIGPCKEYVDFRVYLETPDEEGGGIDMLEKSKLFCHQVAKA
jgi:hypothetical protein